MATVTHTVAMPDGSTPAAVGVSIRLMADTGTGASPAYLTSSGGAVEGESDFTADGGTWSRTLVANGLITPANTWYRIVERVGKLAYTWTVSVDGDGDLSGMLIDPPTALATAASQAAIDAAIDALGLGTMATQAASSVAITGGTVAGIADLAVADGGTGASTAAAGLGNLGGVAHQARGNVAVFLGDSITWGAEGIAPNWRSISYPVYASICSKQQIFYKRNAGVGGDTSEQMLARFDTDVAPYTPSVVFVLAGTNDMGPANDWPISRSIVALTAIFLKCKQIGATPIVCTIPPNTTGTPADRQKRVVGLNAWLRRHAQLNGYPLVDVYKLFVNPADGTWQTAYYSDGTHPNHAGYAALGQFAADSLASQLRPIYPPIPLDLGDTFNLAANGLFIGDTNSDGLANSWSKAGTLATPSLVTGDATIQGNWQKVGSITGTYTVFQTVSAGIVPAHLYAFVGRVRVTNLTGGTVTARVLWNGVAESSPFTGTYEIRAMSGLDAANIADGTFYIETTAPSDATTAQLNFQVFTGPATSWQFAQVGLYDLTAMGLA